MARLAYFGKKLDDLREQVGSEDKALEQRFTTLLGTAVARFESVGRLDGTNGGIEKSGNAADGSLMIGQTLICWGRKRLAPLNKDNLNARPFKFAFRQHFAEDPIVTNAILTKSSSISFAVYNWEISPTEYSGGVISDVPATAEVTFEYIAIGRAR